MPIMIPPSISKNAPKLKKEIFEIFKHVIKGRDWEILHSVSIDSQTFDFIILIPESAFVICLEVVEEQLYEQNPEKTIPPISEGQKAMETLKAHFSKSHFKTNSPLAFGYAVVAPNDDLITGDNRFCTVRAPNCLEDRLEAYALEWANWDRMSKDSEIRQAEVDLNELRTDLVSTGKTVKQIATIFHDNLETHRPRLLQLTEDQIKCLHLVGCQLPTEIPDELTETDANPPNYVIDGAAGTGKTVLAIEVARQRCKKGETVALMCSNPYLSHRFERWAKELSSDNGGRVVAGTPATLPLKVLEGRGSHQEEYWSGLEDSSSKLKGTLKFGYRDHGWEPFIEEIVEALKLLKPEDMFDYLIVDEAQNLCDEVFLKLMDALLKKGLAKGKWAMFGDFVNQKIIRPNSLIVPGDENTVGKEGTKALEERSPCPEWEYEKLTINCRNTFEISNEVDRLVHIESPSRSGVYGPHVQIEYFSDPRNELGKILDNLIVTWQGRDFKSEQIILLSSGIGDEFNTEREYGGWKLHNISTPETTENPGDPSDDGKLRYSDVYDFQGLESDLVILLIPITDKQDIIAGVAIMSQEDHLNKILYTGMSRARTMLTIVAHEGYKDTLEERPFLRDLKKASNMH